MIENRDFVIVRVTSSDGLTGLAYSLSRGAPVDLVVSEQFAPVLLGGDAQDLAARMGACRQAVLSLGDVGLVGQALSLLDICLWDIKARAAGMPLWRLLGGQMRPAPVMLVAPYAADDESDEDYAERVGDAVSRGYRMVKLYPTPRLDAMAARLRAIRQVVGDDVGLVVDLGWMWRRAADAIPVIRDWEPFRLAWVEDPIPAEFADELKSLADAVATPVAAGDEVTVRSHVEALLRNSAVDVLRLDGATIGGISGVQRLRELARECNKPISPHVYPEFHRHCVFAWPEVSPLETFPTPCATWGSDRFVVGDAAAIDKSGNATPPSEPGLGLEFDWDSVASLARRYSDSRTEFRT